MLNLFQHPLCNRPGQALLAGGRFATQTGSAAATCPRHVADRRYAL